MPVEEFLLLLEHIMEEIHLLLVSLLVLVVVLVEVYIQLSLQMDNLEVQVVVVLDQEVLVEQAHHPQTAYHQRVKVVLVVLEFPVLELVVVEVLVDLVLMPLQDLLHHLLVMVDRVLQHLGFLRLSLLQQFLLQ
jgi:hypothetical protein